MRIYFTDQSKHFPDHLEFLKTQPVMPYGKANLIAKTTTISIDVDKDLKDIDPGFFYGYMIFPKRIMTFLTQWKAEEREMRAGDTIVQQAFVPPFNGFSQKIIFGVRIKEIINGPAKIGFSYETLTGHAEKGISTFTIEQTIDSGIVFRIQTFSTPGNLLTRLFGRVFTVPYQTFCTRQALLNVKRQLEAAEMRSRS